MSSTSNSIQNFACILMTPRASPLRSVIAPRNTFPLCQVHIFSPSLSLSILRATQHFFIIAVATVHQRLFTTPRTITGWNQSTGRTAWNQSTQARPPEPLIFGRGLLLHTVLRLPQTNGPCPLLVLGIIGAVETANLRHQLMRL